MGSNFKIKSKFESAIKGVSVEGYHPARRLKNVSSLTAIATDQQHMLFALGTSEERVSKIMVRGAGKPNTQRGLSKNESDY